METIPQTLILRRGTGKISQERKSKQRESLPTTSVQFLVHQNGKIFMSEEVKITGGCLCGAIRYEADHDPLVSALCHCRMCQKNFGSAFSAALGFKSSGFRILSGEPISYQSSEFVRRSFCGSCGSPIAYQRDDTEFVAIQMGTLDEPEKYGAQSANLHRYKNPVGGHPIPSAGQDLGNALIQGFPRHSLGHLDETLETRSKFWFIRGVCGPSEDS